jgi:hypothetical protein
MSYHDFDASYVLMRNKIGKIIALHVGPHHKRSKICVWVPKCLVSNLRGLNRARVDALITCLGREGCSHCLRRLIVQVIASHLAIIAKVKSLGSVKLLSQPNIQSLKFFSLNH